MSMWEQWRATIDLSLREAELSRARHEEQHLRELHLSAGRRAEGAAERGPLARPTGWLLRAAQMAASWLA
jgi:hypothetical protein